MIRDKADDNHRGMHIERETESGREREKKRSRNVRNAVVMTGSREDQCNAHM